jgi:hypothetical protein
MSDVSQGPGWWIASDGKWYPPEDHPDYRPPPQVPEVPSWEAHASQSQPQAPGPQIPGPQIPGPQIPQTAAYTPPRAQLDPRAALEGKGFIRSLYDFSFSSLVTLRVIRVLYVLITILYTLAAVIIFAGLLIKHTAAGVVIAIVGVPIAYFIYLTCARIALEVLMIVFNIGKDVRAIRERGDATARHPVGA